MYGLIWLFIGYLEMTTQGLRNMKILNGAVAEVWILTASTGTGIPHFE